MELTKEDKIMLEEYLNIMYDHWKECLYEAKKDGDSELEDYYYKEIGECVVLRDKVRGII